jgi:uncharacterized protein (TIGR03905 family)
MHCTFAPKGVCSKSLSFDLDDGLIMNLRFQGGCDGNLKGLALLAEGRPASEVAAALTGVVCGRKKTSCPDQLAKAVKKALGGGQASVAPTTARRPAAQKPPAASDVEDALTSKAVSKAAQPTAKTAQVRQNAASSPKTPTKTPPKTAQVRQNAASPPKTPTKTAQVRQNAASPPKTTPNDPSKTASKSTPESTVKLTVSSSSAEPDAVRPSRRTSRTAQAASREIKP